MNDNNTTNKILELLQWEELNYQEIAKRLKIDATYACTILKKLQKRHLVIKTPSTWSLEKTK
jgi:predicted transcriptional regulator